MGGEPAERPSDRDSFESRVLAGLAAINSRLFALEAKVDRVETKIDGLEVRVDGLEARLTALEVKSDARLHETRPIWEAALSGLEVIDSKLDVLGIDMLEMRAELNRLKKRQPPAD